MPSPRTSVEQYYSVDIHHLLPNVQYSRPLYRFSNGNQPGMVDLNARIVDIRDVEDDLRMESMFLKQNKNIPLGRSSTPDPSYCCHCDHKHRERCCLYLGDKMDDLNRYSAWTEDFKNTPVKPQNVKCIPEAVSYNTTPHWFPRYTSVKPDRAKGATPKAPHKPLIKPFQTTESSQDLLNPNRRTTLAPYHQYLVHLRQLTEDSPFQIDLTNPYFAHTDINRMFAYAQQMNNQHIYNGPVYMQQNNHSPYSNHHTFPYGPYQHPSHQQHPSPCSVHPYCAQRAASHPQRASQLPPPPGFANPAAQVHSGGVSFPLWMLFSYNQSKATAQASDGRRCARRLYGFNGGRQQQQQQQQVDHNCNLVCMKGCVKPVRMDVEEAVGGTI